MWPEASGQAGWGGLEVCRIDLNNNNNISLNVGRPGKDNAIGPARRVFIDILVKEKLLKSSKDFPEKGLAFGASEPEIKKVVSAISALAQSRKSDALKTVKREHLLESQVLVGMLKVVTANGELEPVFKDYPFQFPTLWEKDGSPRFVDALMRIGNIPYVVELKDSKGSKYGQYYRHGITQAVLYREFIRRETRVHDWFRELGLEPTKCKAVLAFPKMVPETEKKKMLVDQLVLAGKAFGVEVAEIDGFM